MSDHTTTASAHSAEHAAAPRYSRKLRHWLSVCSLALADIVAFGLAGLLFREGRVVPTWVLHNYVFFEHTPIHIFYVLGLIFVVVRYVLGDYSRRQLFWDGAKLTTVALLITAIPDFLALGFVDGHYSIAAAIGSWGFLLVAVPAMRHLARWLLSKVSIWQLPTALLGDGPNTLEAFHAFRNSLSLGFDVRFVVSLGEVPDETLQLPGVTCLALRDPANIVRRLSNAGCVEAVLATEGQTDSETDDLIQRFMAADIGVAIIPPVRRLPLLGLTTNYFFGRDLLLLQVRNNLGRLPGRIFKRLIDVVGSAIVFVLSLPVFVFVAFCIKRDDGGPVFFQQLRVGRGGVQFRCIKFRTMRLDAEEQLHRWKQENSHIYAEYCASNFKLRNDSRVTKAGRWLRRTSLDELPQIINVLKGEMSLVGPRPMLEREIGEYGQTYKLYQQIRPGITGLWQISGRSHTSFADRAASDEWYIKNWSFWHDLVILIQTVWVLIIQDGAY